MLYDDQNKASSQFRTFFILNECCAERNDLINNPDNSNSITRGIADAIIAPFIYIPMFF